jgi:tRNA dimethylallyltransferase
VQIDSALLRECWFLTGPTACGKTASSLSLAEQLNGEIVALDSMSLYRRMDIGTAKPTLVQRRRVPHHLIDVIDPHDEFSVADYLQLAEQACREILNRGRIPLFVGGTGLYLRSLLRGVFDGPPADSEFRRAMQQEAERDPETLHRRLVAVDPDSAQRLHANDRRRIIRALEIHHATGRRASELQSQRPLPPHQRPRHTYWLSPSRVWLYRRIDERVEQMMDDGLLKEVEDLLALPRKMSRTARQALGYRELIQHLHGEFPLEEAVRHIQARTRQFAKRQHTWFRNLEECREIPVTGEETPQEIVGRLRTIAER